MQLWRVEAHAPGATFVNGHAAVFWASTAPQARASQKARRRRQRNKLTQKELKTDEEIVTAAIFLADPSTFGVCADGGRSP